MGIEFVEWERRRGTAKYSYFIRSFIFIFLQLFRMNWTITSIACHCTHSCDSANLTDCMTTVFSPSLSSRFTISVSTFRWMHFAYNLFCFSLITQTEIHLCVRSAQCTIGQVRVANECTYNNTIDENKLWIKTFVCSFNLYIIQFRYCRLCCVVTASCDWREWTNLHMDARAREREREPSEWAQRN